MSHREGSVRSFEAQAAYLEGRADLAQQMMALAARGREYRYSKGMLVREIETICSATMHYDTEMDQA